MHGIIIAYKVWNINEKIFLNIKRDGSYLRVEKVVLVSSTPTVLLLTTLELLNNLVICHRLRSL